MTIVNIRREVKNVLQDMGVAPKAITDKADFQKDLGLDSLDFVEMIMQFEVRFNIDIPTMELEGIKTIQQAIDYLDASLKRKNTFTN